MSVTVSAQVDEELAERLDDAENKSEIVRSALRQYFEEEDLDVDLSDREETAYRELLRLTRGGGTIRKEIAETVLAQAVGIEKAIIKSAIFVPLERDGLIKPANTWDQSFIRVFPPEEVAVDA